MTKIFQALEAMDKDGKGTGNWNYTYHEDEGPKGDNFAAGGCQSINGCKGHSMPEDALYHYAKWRAENHTKYGQDFSALGNCVVCTVPTQWKAYVGGDWQTEFWLCVPHVNEDVELIYLLLMKYFSCNNRGL